MAVVCVHLPRFELTAAVDEPAGLAEQALAGGALAIAPTVGSVQCVGEVSGAAEARGVERGMMLGEAVARCPDLVLVPGDPARVAETWERMLAALESIGAAVEPAYPGLAYFDGGGLRGLYGGRRETIAAARRALGRPARIGAGPTRFAALAAALATRSRRALVLDEGDVARWLAARPVELLGHREETVELVEPLRRLGVRTLGELVGLGRPALADRFGAPGAIAHALACGQDSPLRPRRPQERLEEAMEVAQAGSGEALARVLGVLVDRLLARRERHGRTVRALGLYADLVSGGSWHERVVLRQPLSDRERIWLALSLRLATLPAPAASLRLVVEDFGPPASEQSALLERSHAARMARLAEAVAQVRAVAGEDAALRAVCVDPDSRVPERRVVLAPIPQRAV